MVRPNTTKSCITDSIFIYEKYKKNLQTYLVLIISKLTFPHTKLSGGNITPYVYIVIIVLCLCLLKIITDTIFGKDKSLLKSIVYFII